MSGWNGPRNGEATGGGSQIGGSPPGFFAGRGKEIAKVDKTVLRLAGEFDDHGGVSGPEVVVHGHFYQPPRENPWTEEVGRERSAAPFHDWNERIAAESYRPNAVARVVDENGNVVSIVNNYEMISYNVGPTLLSWLEKHDPETYRLMVESDAKGMGAIAQAYGHTILPLASERDMRLQIRWGLADFRHRFGREALGMWLAECAVNDDVLAALIEEGVKFTVLAPGQAAKIRSIQGIHNWVDVHQSWFDTGRPYRWEHPSGDGRHLEIFFYNGSLSHAVAFEMSSMNSQALVDRIMAASLGRVGLVTIATDGESFGHHHRYGDRLLAYALAVEAKHRHLTHTNFNKALDEMQPTHQVQIHESAWSCAHGVGRWKEDCGCSTGGAAGWNQKWRAPLRSALDNLRAIVQETYDRRAPEVFNDHEAALDNYVLVMINAMSRKEFAEQYVTGDWVEAFTLLEMQRHAQSMFTSCGWFFNDLSGIETVQVLRYAARVMDLLDELDEPSPLDEFLTILEQARSNIPEEGTGTDVWSKHVEPSRVTVERALQHVVLSELLEDEPASSFGPFEVENHGYRRDQVGSTTLVTGVARVTHALTGRVWLFAYGALGLGGLEIVGSMVKVDSVEDESPLVGIRESFARRDTVSQLVRELTSIGELEFDLSSALPDERERLMERTANGLEERYAEAYERLYEQHRATIEDLARHGYDLPSVLRAPAELALAHRFQAAVLGAESSTDPAAYEEALTIARQARAAGFEVESPASTSFMQRLLDDVVLRAVEKPSARAIRVALDVLQLTSELPAKVNIEKLQEAVYQAVETPGSSPLLRQLATALQVRAGN